MIYTYDGTFDGLLTCIHQHYYLEHASEIMEEIHYQPTLFEEVKFVETDLIKAKRVYDAIMKQFSEETYWDIYRTYLSNNRMKDTYILRYLIMAFKMGQKIELLHAHHDTLPVRRISRAVGFEKHRFLGLLRFAEIDHVLYAAFEPDHNILILLGEHFADRLANERFVIHDMKRVHAIFCDHWPWIISDFKMEQPITYSDNELAFQALWKGYFEAIAIESRQNLKLQQSFVPLKYRKHLTEFH
ncbi:MAG: TIGR03915 family putative DNA repair protein [Vallitaleaceae bacterium]|jgi:probable DNA metabolism protein|nr:TIGR03915 family putative DNA repair protein [Vallitaleaceae bacterium]